ncbi:hypothetical protein Bca52824_040943 [Brassica carinata]|uniref:Uncharacterized protein n=1 Tax=Brassica carinata TaxID=52824 RepID=A0A8X7RS87_BRACI|nr:hypothetical protein Bca52824_040943 [Brassica carinata]
MMIRGGVRGGKRRFQATMTSGSLRHDEGAEHENNHGLDPRHGQDRRGNKQLYLKTPSCTLGPCSRGFGVEDCSLNCSSTGCYFFSGILRLEDAYQSPSGKGESSSCPRNIV